MKLNHSGLPILLPISLVLVAASVGCGDIQGTADPHAVSGTLLIDGSSTIFPIAEAIADEFMHKNPGARVSVASTGTGAGMDKFGRGEIEVATASRVIKPEEIQRLKEANIDFIEVPVAFDGITIMVNPQNTWLKQITMEQLHEIWKPDSTIRRWNQIDPSFPNQPINLYGPTSVHGTFEYFNEVVNGDPRSTRTDYAQMADYQQLVLGISRDRFALGYTGFAFYEENKELVRAVPISIDGRPPVMPSHETIAGGQYTPFARPLLFYVRKDAVKGNPLILPVFQLLFSPAGAEAISDTGYIPLPAAVQTLALERLTSLTTGSVLKTATPGTPLAEVLRKKEGQSSPVQS